MKKNKNYFQNKAETSFKGFKWFIYALLACASYTYLFINLFNFDDNWKMFMNTLLTIIIVPMFFSLGNKFLDRFFHFQDTYQLCIETEYKYEHGLIDKPEYERRMKELKKMENKIVSPYNKKTKKTKKKGNNYMLTAILTGVIVIIFLVLGSVFFRNYLNWGDGLISYAGAIIGGGLTLIGVAITLYYQTESRKADQEQHEIERQDEFNRRDKEIKNNLSTQYKPILTISFDEEFIDDSFGITNFRGFNTQNTLTLVNDSIDEDQYNIIFHFSIFNIGRGEASNIKINPFLISLSDIDNMQTVYRCYNELYTSNKLDITFSMEISENNWKLYNDKDYVYNNPIFMKINVEYTDLVGRKYTLETDIAIKGLTSRANENNKKLSNRLFLNPYDTIIYNETK